MLSIGICLDTSKLQTNKYDEIAYVLLDSLHYGHAIMQCGINTLGSILIPIAKENAGLIYWGITYADG